MTTAANLAEEALSLALVWMPGQCTDSDTNARLQGAKKQIREALAALRAMPTEERQNTAASLLRGMALALEQDIQGRRKVVPAGMLEVVRTALSYLPSPQAYTTEKS